MKKKKKRKTKNWEYDKKTYSEFFTEEEIETIKKHCEKKKIDIQKFEENYPLQMTERERQKIISSGKPLTDCFCSTNEYDLILKDIKKDNNIKRETYLELYCAMDNKEMYEKKVLTNAEEGIRTKCYNIVQRIKM